MEAKKSETGDDGAGDGSFGRQRLHNRPESATSAAAKVVDCGRAVVA